MEKKKRNEREYRKIIWDSIIYLFFHRKELAKDFAKYEPDEWGSKFIRFGMIDNPKESYVIDFKISE